MRFATICTSNSVRGFQPYTEIPSVHGKFVEVFVFRNGGDFRFRFSKLCAIRNDLYSNRTRRFPMYTENSSKVVCDSQFSICFLSVAMASCSSSLLTWVERAEMRNKCSFRRYPHDFHRYLLPFGSTTTSYIDPMDYIVEVAARIGT